jgi:hypothetical protein
MLKQILFAIVLLSIISCNQSNVSTKLTILGTMHFPTEKINADSIYRVLKRVNPDFILMEADSSIFNPDFSFKKTFDENEYNAVIKYKKENPSVKIRPIEFEGRNEYRKSIGLFPGASIVFKKLNKLNKEKLFDINEQKVWDRFGYFWSLSDSINNGNLQSLNSPSTDKIIDSLMNYQYVEIKKIINKRNEFENSELIDAKKDTVTIKDYFNKWANFEGNIRNSALSKNILNIVKENTSSTIIVLTGYQHRFYIVKNVKSQEKKYNFELKEFYEY